MAISGGNIRYNGLPNGFKSEKIEKITSIMEFFYNDDLQWSALYGILLIICIKRRFSRKTAFKCEVYSYEQEIFLQAISGRK